jgi:hypothetical protein
MKDIFTGRKNLEQLDSRYYSTSAISFYFEQVFFKKADFTKSFITVILCP